MMWGKTQLISLVLILLAILFTGAGTILADGVPVWFEDTTNLYQVFTTGASFWADAGTAAAGQISTVVPPEGFACTESHLVTITSPEENQFLIDTFGTGVLADKWLGGFQAENQNAPDAGWAWVTGETWDFTFWNASTSEPNDGGATPGVEDGEEQFLEWHQSGGGWNDEFSQLAANTGYVVEYECEPVNQPPDCTTAYSSIDMIWPPNHNMQPVNVLGVTDPDGDEVTMTIMSISSNEPTNGTGDGDTDSDWGTDEDTAWVRAERAGTGSGRVYTIEFEASDGLAACNGTLAVSVPHDRRGGNGNNGGASGNNDDTPGHSGDAPGQGIAQEASSHGQAQRAAHAGGNSNAQSHSNGHAHGGD